MLLKISMIALSQTLIVKSIQSIYHRQQPRWFNVLYQKIESVMEYITKVKVEPETTRHYSYNLFRIFH